MAREYKASLKSHHMSPVMDVNRGNSSQLSHGRSQIQPLLAAQPTRCQGSEEVSILDNGGIPLTVHQITRRALSIPKVTVPHPGLSKFKSADHYINKAIT